MRLPIPAGGLTAAGALDRYVLHVAGLAPGAEAGVPAATAAAASAVSQGASAAASASAAAPPVAASAGAAKKKGRPAKEVGASAAAAAAPSPAEAAAAAAADDAAIASKAAATTAALAAAAASLAPAVITARAITRGVREYFDRAAGTYVLYRFERPQFEALLREKYGGDKGAAPRLSEVSVRRRRPSAR